MGARLLISDLLAVSTAGDLVQLVRTLPSTLCADYLLRYQSHLGRYEFPHSNQLGRSDVPVVRIERGAPEVFGYLLCRSTSRSDSPNSPFCHGTPSTAVD